MMNNLLLPLAPRLFRRKILALHYNRLCVFILIFLLAVWPFLPVAAQKSQLQAGPMVGAATNNAVKLWVQTKKEASVSFTITDVTEPDKKWQTNPVKTTSESAFAVTVTVQNLKPSTKYNYQLSINQKPVKLHYELSFFTAPDTAFGVIDITFAAGSCAFASSDSLHPTFAIYPEILKQKPQFMLWLGDNLYLDSKDWSTKKGYFNAYSHSRRVPALQPLLASVHHYAIWDDHDYGANDANKNWPHKAIAAEAFKTFWPNPTYPDEGLYSSFTWGDAQFFLLDARWFRTSPRGSKTSRQMLGDKQIEWLLTELKKSKATFKFICIGSQMLSTNNGSEKYRCYKYELDNLLEKFEDENINGLVVLDGDVHYTELSKYTRKKTYPLFGLTVSPLTSTPSRGKKNFNRVPGTLVTERNFAILTITGEPGNRILNMRIHNASGNQLWQRQIHQNELKD